MKYNRSHRKQLVRQIKAKIANDLFVRENPEWLRINARANSPLSSTYFYSARNAWKSARHGIVYGIGAADFAKCMKEFEHSINRNACYKLDLLLAEQRMAVHGKVTSILRGTPAPASSTAYKRNVETLIIDDLQGA